MKKLILFSMSVLIAFFVNAQVVEETSPQLAQPKAPNYNSSLLLDVDVPCRVFVDGASKGEIIAGDPLVIPLNPGQRLLQLKDEFGNQLHKSTIELEKDKQVVLTLLLNDEYQRLKKQHTETEENTFWEQCKNQNTSEALQQYLTKYPAGRYANEAQQRIYALKDKIMWENALAGNTKDVFETYLKTYPDGIYRNKAKQRIEDFDWSETLQQNTATAYQQHLSTYPTGKYAAEANAWLEEEDWKTATTKNTVEGYRSFLKLHSAGKYAEQAGTKVALDIYQKTGIKMVFVKGGTFTMGENEGAHQVTLDGYFMGMYEVTQEQWRKFMGKLPEDNNSCSGCPVGGVSWNSANEFISELNQKTKMNFRLPTEAEWEYAARGGQKSKDYVYAGSDNIAEVAWITGDGNKKYKAHPVGQLKPNELGIYDMSGNVSEWCSDLYDAFYYKSSPDNNPKGPTSGLVRVVRGGSWLEDAKYCRSSSRYDDSYYLSTTGRYYNGGFRLSQDF